MNRRYDDLGRLRRMLVAVAVYVFLAVACRQPDPLIILQEAVEKRFPDLSLDHYITNEEVATLLSLEEARKDEELLNKWELFAERKRFAPALIQRYDSQTDPVHALSTLLKLSKRRPEYADRVLRILREFNAKSSYSDILNGLPATVSGSFLKLNLSSASWKALESVLESIPGEKTYVLALYKLSTSYRFPVNAKDVYRTYEAISPENYVVVLKESPFAKFGLVEPENSQYGLASYLVVRDLYRATIKSMRMRKE